MAREHDLIVYGASGYVGALTAKYLAEHGPEGAKVALGGRNEAKLEGVRAGLGGTAAEWPIVVADSSDPDAMRRMAESATAIATTVGPYAKYGMGLVEACAAAGTHYADLTGEVLFMRDAIDRHHDAAKQSGARIVHTCGFDSIPSDLGVFLLADAAEERGLGELGETTFVVKRLRGGASGGTIDSLRGMVDEVRRDKTRRKILLDPYGLSPDRSAEPDLGSERDPAGVSHDPEFGGFLAPFVMGTVNTRVVRRSNALSDYSYGRQLRYRELMATGGWPLGPVRAGAVAGGIGAAMAGFALKPTRKLMDRFLPAPGEGPSKEARERGFFEIEIHSRTSNGTKLVCDVKAQGDPGYKATAVMLGEAGLTLALDGEKLPPAAGVLTPATAMGNVLVERLRAAGHTYAVRP